MGKSLEEESVDFYELFSLLKWITNEASNSQIRALIAIKNMCV